MEIQQTIASRREIVVDARPASALTWSEIRRFAFRHKAVIALVFLGTVVGAYGTLSLLSEEYQTDAKLLVKLGRENLDPPPTTRNAVISTGVRPEEVSTEIQIVKSPDLAEKVVDEIGVAAFRSTPVKPANFMGQVRFYLKAAARQAKQQYGEFLITLDLKKRLDDRQKAVNMILEGLDARPEKESDVMTLSFRSSNPALARDIEQKLIMLYLQRRTLVRRYSGADAFLTNESEQLHQQLTRAENQRNDWMRAHNLTSSGEQKSLLLQQIRDLSSESNQTVREIETYTRQVRETGRQMDTTPANLKASEQQDPNPMLRSLKEKFIDLNAQRAHLLTKYQADSDPVHNLDSEIARISEMMRAEQSTQQGPVLFQLNPLRQSLEKTRQDVAILLAGLQSKALVQRMQLAQLRSDLTAVNEAENKLLDLERTRQMAERSYLEFQKRKEDSDIANQLDTRQISNVSVIAPPVSTMEPVYPRKTVIMGVSLVLGLALGIAFALMLDYLDDRVYDPRRLESQVDLPYMGAVTFSPRALAR